MCRLAFFLLVFAALTELRASAKVLTDLTGNLPCANITMLTQSLTTFPAGLQRALRVAVRASIQSIVSNKGMGMESAAPEKVPLNAIKVGKVSLNSSIYIVSWDDSSFGVNGAIWIVEVVSGRAKNLVRLRGGQAAGNSLSGFGFEVLSPNLKGYPEIMLASSGFKDGGGAEAEEVCIRKTGNYYEKTPCPAICHEALNHSEQR